MNVWIARDGEQIGEYPREQLDRMAQAKELQKSDHYWHDGMENWRQLDELLSAQAWQPPPPPSSPLPPFRILLSAIGAALVLIIAIVAFFASRHPAAPVGSATPVPKPSVALVGQPDPIRNDRAARDKASNELIQKLNQLTVVPTQPSYVYYSGLSIVLTDPPEPLTATIHGSENVLNPETQQASSRTDFLVTAEFRQSAWYFRYYHEVANDFVHKTTAEMEKDDRYPVPPAIVSLLGLRVKTPAAVPTSIEHR